MSAIMRLWVTMALALAVTLLSAATPAWCDPQAPADAKTVSAGTPATGTPASATGSAPASATADAPASATAKPAHFLVRKAEALKVSGEALFKRAQQKLSGDALFKRAEQEFPGFCKDWGSKLMDRQRNNLTHIHWQVANGEETGAYVGYGTIQSCTCKQSSKGIPVGKLFYQEFEYSLKGKTLDEAQHATPQTGIVTNTTEIFRWDKKLGKWIY